MERPSKMTTHAPRASSAERQGKMWGARASDWTNHAEPGTAPLFEATLDAIGVFPGMRHLDVGCGAGLACALSLRRGARVAGIDASEALIAIARDRLPGADLRVGEMENLPFPDGAFDVVTGFNSFQFAADRVRALEEARRVTRAGGVLGFAVWDLPERCQSMTILKALKVLVPAPPEGEPPHVPMATPGVLPSLLGAAGWKIEGHGEVSCPFVYPDLAVAKAAFLSAGGTADALSAAPSEVDRVFEGALLPFRLASGGYRLENQFLYVIARA